jgi:trimethylamine:corrinoid methyltransferase-like protein
LRIFKQLDKGDGQMIRTSCGGIDTVRFLTQSDMQKIHEQSLFLLENTGIGIEHQAGIEILEKAGGNHRLQQKNGTHTTRACRELLENGSAENHPGGQEP